MLASIQGGDIGSPDILALQHFAVRSEYDLSNVERLRQSLGALHADAPQPGHREEYLVVEPMEWDTRSLLAELRLCQPRRTDVS